MQSTSLVFFLIVNFILVAIIIGTDTKPENDDMKSFSSLMKQIDNDLVPIQSELKSLAENANETKTGPLFKTKVNVESKKNGTKSNKHHKRKKLNEKDVHKSNKTNLNQHQHHHRHLKNTKKNNVIIGHKQQKIVNAVKPSDIPKAGRRTRFINIPDNWDRIPFILQTYNEPEPEKYYLMPALSNGFIGTTVKNSSIYVNGLYNGYQSRSHRVRIPSMTSIEPLLTLGTDTDSRTYNFDCRRGVYTIETKNVNSNMQQRFYVHRRYKNIIINEIRIELTNNQAVTIDVFNNTKLELDSSYINSPLNPNKYSYYYQENDPENISFEHRVIRQPTYVKDKRLDLNDGVYYLQATIPLTELSNKRQKQIHTYYTNVPTKLYVYTNTTVKYFHFIQSVDSDNNRAKSAYDDAVRMIQQDPTSLFVSHVAAWEDVWQKSGMAMMSESSYNENNLEAFKLAQKLYVSFYNLYSSLPSSYDNQFYGLSPSGLAYGSLKSEYFNLSTNININRHISEGYGGHVTYHQELWILTLISLFNSDMSRTIINSRLRKGLNTDHLSVYEQARELAKQESLEGLRYPWEMADYGVEVSPNYDAIKKIHTGADISFGIRNYLRVSHNREFLLQSLSSELNLKGEDYIHELAKYWADKFQYDSLTDRYGIKEVSFGDKSQSREINNEAFTNQMGQLTMDTYKYILKLTDRNPYDQQYSYLVNKYDDIEKKLNLPYDNFKELFLEYEGFTTAHTNEETFVPFLNYPVQKKFTYRQKKAIYDTYANQLPNDGKNLLSYASYSIGYMELNEEAKSKDYLNRFSNHFNGPFLVLSEYPQNNILNPLNNFNYLPGYAAFIHSFIAGYCGLRIQDFQIDLVYPTENFGEYLTSVGSALNQVFRQPATNAESWNITGISYRGSKLDIIYNFRTKSVEIRNRRSNEAGFAGDDNLQVAIYEGTEVTVKQLRIGDSVSISLSTELWTYAAKKSRLQKNNLYSNNMHVLATIYSLPLINNLQKPSSANVPNMNSFSLLIILLINFFLVKNI